jgi:uncharacterized protein DUF3833
VTAVGVLAGCLSSGPPHAGRLEEPVLRPEMFFSGPTRGEGTLVTLTGSRQSLRVEGHGYTEADGTFRLDQTVTYSNAETKTRTWRLLKGDSKRYTATLSDVPGEVTAEATGNLFHLRYRLRAPAIYMEQWLYLQPDGRTVLNFATVTVIGIPWAQLSEEIKKIGTKDIP